MPGAFDRSERGPLSSIRARDNRPGESDVSAGDLAPGGTMGLYVHFPFCGVHCPYCDFAVDVRADIPHDRYADAVVAEITARAGWFQRRDDSPRLVSIYFGGGTPGLWRSSALARVIVAGKEKFVADDDAGLEITVEANPGEMVESKFRELCQVGVNRVSLGLQSLDDRLLRAIGRNHDAAAGPVAVNAARSAGIENVSVDLMFGLPGQSMDDWRRTVDGVLRLRPNHVSAYALTIERGTPFGARARKGELPVPDDDQTASMQEWAREALAADGLSQYEVSSYAAAGRRAVHNSLYWTGAPYLGVGASAASFRPLADGAGWRFSNPRATETYLRATETTTGGSPRPAKVEKRRANDLENEVVWLALRTTDGLDRTAHALRFGMDPVSKRSAEVNACVARGWLVLDDRALRPTPAGLLFADEIAKRLWL